MSTRPVRAVSKLPKAVPTMVDEGLVVIDMALEPIAADDGAVGILSQRAQENGGAEGALVFIPDEIRQALQRRDASDLPSMKMRFHVGTRGYSCRVFLVRARSGQAHQPMLALHMQKDSSVADAIDQLAAEYHLSDREQEALKAIAQGLSSKETAERMNISPNTVKSFLRLIMIKMGVGTRAGIVAKLLEYSNGNGHGGS